MISMDEYTSDEFCELYDELVPERGKADSVAGEMLRAAGRIGYRYYNDGEFAYDPTADDIITDLADSYYNHYCENEDAVKEAGYDDPWDAAQDRAEREYDEDPMAFIDNDWLNAGATTHYLLTKGDSEVALLAQKITSKGSDWDRSGRFGEYEQTIQQLMGAVVDDISEHPELMWIPTEDMFDHRMEPDEWTGECRRTQHFDWRQDLDAKWEAGEFDDVPGTVPTTEEEEIAVSLKRPRSGYLSGIADTLISSFKSIAPEAPKTGDIDVSGYSYMRNGKRVNVKPHKRKRSAKPRR